MLTVVPWGPAVALHVLICFGGKAGCAVPLTLRLRTWEACGAVGALLVHSAGDSAAGLVSFDCEAAARSAPRVARRGRR